MVREGELPISSKDEIGAKVKTSWFQAAATGQWALGLIAFASLIGMSYDGLAKHVDLAVIVTVVGAFLVGRASANRELNLVNALRLEADHEVKRIAGSKRVLEEQLIEERVSSEVEGYKRQLLEKQKKKKKKGGRS